MAFAVAAAFALAVPAAATDKTASKTAKGASTTTRGGTLPGVSSAAGGRTTSILGAAWHTDNQPVPRANLRLRNVLTGRVEATTVANDLGQFVFTEVESGTYTIELVTSSGKVLTIGHRFTVAPGETVATFVRLGTKVPWFNGFFGNAASAVSSSAASTGITAVAPEGVRPVSARR
jgi:hypothetical protein